MEGRSYRIELTNENSVAWFETTSTGSVYQGSENILQHVLNLELSDALKILELRGWVVEDWGPYTRSKEIDE